MWKVPTEASNRAMREIDIIINAGPLYGPAFYIIGNYALLYKHPTGETYCDVQSRMSQIAFLFI